MKTVSATAATASALKKQNPCLSNGSIEIIKIVSDIKNNDQYDAIVQLDNTSFNNVMKTKKVFINFERCVVKEHFSILRCHKCSGFNHTKEFCTAQNAICGYCSGDHLSTECRERNWKCVNCTNANIKLNLSLSTNHHVWSRKCEILTNKINRFCQKVQYEDIK